MDQASFVTVVSAVLAVILLIDVSVLWLTGKQVPELLTQLVMGVFASYFVSGLARPKGSGAGVRKPKAPQITQEKEAMQEKEGE